MYTLPERTDVDMSFFVADHVSVEK